MFADWKCKWKIQQMLATLPLIDRYLAANAAYGHPFSLRLTQRGHYSEVNCLIAAMVYGLIHRRRFVVDQSQFEGLRWTDLYSSELPTALPSIVESIAPDWMLLKDGDRRFASVRRRTHRHHMRRLPVWNPTVGRLTSVFQASRLLAAEFCRPAQALPAPSYFLRPYAAFHIRRGDKVLGSLVDGKRTIPEGQDIPVTAYLELLSRKAPSINHVWVMTDDYGAVEQLRSAAPSIHFETTCDPSARGYEQTEFSARPVKVKLAERQALIAETEVAARSAVFIGGFSSNVDRFIMLRHHDPKACFSVDREKRWYPA